MSPTNGAITMAAYEDSTKTIKSVDKALNVLEAISLTDGGVNLTHLSKTLDMNKSGVYRLLQVFKQRGYVEQRNSGEYHLGMSAFLVGQNIISNMDLLRTARPVMEKLVREVNETVYMALRHEQDVLFFDNIDSQQPVSVMQLRGRRYPLASCAAGRLLLSYSHGREDAVGLEPGTTPEKQGYAVDADALGEGISSVAVPVLNNDKKAAGCLLFVGPSFRFTEEKVHGEFLSALMTAGQVVSTRLGCLDYHLA